MGVTNALSFLFSVVATVLMARMITRIQLDRLVGVHERDTFRPNKLPTEEVH